MEFTGTTPVAWRKATEDTNQSIIELKQDLMATFLSLYLKKLQGKIGNLVFYEAHNQQRIRSCTPGKRLSPPTEAQRLQQNRLRTAVAFYRANRFSALPHIWNMEAKPLVMTGYNLFLSQNMGVFTIDHCIKDYSLLNISCGKLELPGCLNIPEYREGEIHVCWQNILLSNLKRSKDLLHALWLNNQGSFTLHAAAAPPIRRQDEKGVFYIPEAGKEDIHLYLYFSDKQETNFSVSKYFFLRKKN